MITVGMYYDVVPGREQDFEKKFGDVVAVMEDRPGHVQSLLYRQVGRSSSYAILSEWESRDAFTAFLSSDLFRQVTHWGKSGILEGRPRHKVYGDEADVG